MEELENAESPADQKVMKLTKCDALALAEANQASASVGAGQVGASTCCNPFRIPRHVVHSNLRAITLQLRDKFPRQNFNNGARVCYDCRDKMFEVLRQKKHLFSSPRLKDASNNQHKRTLTRRSDVVAGVNGNSSVPRNINEQSSNSINNIYSNNKNVQINVRRVNAQRRASLESSIQLTTVAQDLLQDNLQSKFFFLICHHGRTDQEETRAFHSLPFSFSLIVVYTFTSLDI